MKNLFLIFLTFILFLFIGCQKNEVLKVEPRQDVPMETPIDGLSPDQFAIAGELISRADWPLNRQLAPDELNSRGIGVMGYEREMITEDIAHYTFIVRVGSHELNKIGIHRVVREERPNRPIKTSKTLFFQHGDGKDFPGMVLPGLLSDNLPDDFGLAVFLAQHEVDVWGITQAWNFVPEATTDFTFMADWGIQKQADDLRRAMGIARLARYLTGNDLGQLILAGYSSGVATGITALNDETQLRKGARNINAYIPIDLPIKTDDRAAIDVFLGRYNDASEALANDQYGFLVGFPYIGGFARTAPEGESPIIPGFTNLQAGLFLAGGPINGDSFHYHAATWENGLPADFLYLTRDQWFDFTETGAYYEPSLFLKEYSDLAGGFSDVPFDDHFSEITVPILNLAAAGGMAPYVTYGMTLLGSTDVTNLIVGLLPPEEILFDFGHVDLFTAENAPELVWQPMLEWIETHTDRVE